MDAVADVASLDAMLSGACGTALHFELHGLQGRMACRLDPTGHILLASKLLVSGSLASCCMRIYLGAALKLLEEASSAQGAAEVRNAKQTGGGKSHTNEHSGGAVTWACAAPHPVHSLLTNPPTASPTRPSQLLMSRHKVCCFEWGFWQQG